MNIIEKQNEAKLHILNSLARSQRALAKMVESMAEIYSVSGEKSGANSKEAGHSASGLPAFNRDLVEQMRALAGYQKILAGKIAGIRPRRIRKSKPGKVWLNDRIK